MALIKYLELTKGPYFVKSRTKLEAVITANAAYNRQKTEISMAVATNKVTAWNEIIETESLLHLAGHGTAEGEIGGLFLNRMQVQDFAEFINFQEARLPLDGIILDACSTFSPEWLDHIGQSIPVGSTTLVVGSQGDVPFENAELFSQIFYTELLKRPYPKKKNDRIDAIESAVKVAQKAEAWWFGEPSYFKMKKVTGK